MCNYRIEDLKFSFLKHFFNKQVPTRLTALGWILALHSKTPEQLKAHVDELFLSLLKLLSDQSEEAFFLKTKLY